MGAVPEVVEGGVTGMLGEPDSTVDDLVRRIESGELDRLKRLDCRNRAVSLFSAESMAAGYMAVYEHLLER